MPFLNLPTVALHYETLGSARAPALLLLHGATETFRDGWQRQIDAFSRRYRVLGVDLRGHGRSINRVDRLDLREMADDLADLLDHLGLQHAHVCGFSGGASVALFFAQRHLARLRSLILVSNNFELDTVRTGPARFWDPERVQREEPVWWQAMAQLHEVDTARLLRWWHAEDLLRPDFQEAELRQIAVPALVVGGDRDPLVPLTQSIRLFSALPQAQLAIFPGTGHGIPRRRAAQFNQVVLNFLRHTGADAG